MRKQNKGFTIVEVLTVISIVGILVLLLIPKFQPYIKQAKIAQIKADVKTSELVYDSYSLLEDNYKTKFKKVDNESLSTYLDDGHIYDKHGIVSELNLNSTYYYLDRNLQIGKSSFLDTSLDGSFIVDYDGTVYYIEGSVSTLENEENVVDSSANIFNKIDFNKVVIDSSTEFSFINLPSADAPVVIGDEIFGVNYFDTTSIYVFDRNDGSLKRVMKNYVSQQKILPLNLKRFYSMGTDGEHLLIFRSSTVIDIVDKNTGLLIGSKTLKTPVLSKNKDLIGSSTFVVKDGLLYLSDYYSTEMKIYNYETGELIKKIGGFNKLSGFASNGDKLFVVERDFKILSVFDIKDRLNPVGEIKVKINNNYDLTGIAVDNEYIYFSTYQSNKIVKYPIKEF